MDQARDRLLGEVMAGLVEAEAVGVLVGTGHVIEFASASAREMLGRADVDVAGMDWVGITPPEYRVGDDDAISEAITSGASGWLAKQYVVPDGSRVGLDVLVVALERDPFRWMALLRPTPNPALASNVAVPVAGALLRLARRLAGAGTVAEVFAVVDRLLASALGASYSNIALLDEEAAFLRVHHDPGTDEDVRERWISVPVTSATLLGDSVVKGRVLICHSLDELRSRYPEQGADAERLGLAALAAIPLRTDVGRIMGAMGVAWREGQEIDLDLMRAGAGLVANALELAESVDFDRRVAGTFQQMLLPAAPALATRHDVAIRYRAVDRVVGGDFYDVIEREDGVWLIIGDVAGHGLDAARTMGKTRFFLRALAPSSASPSELLMAVNQLLIDERQSEMVTCLAIRHDPRSNQITLATAGHPGPIVVDDSAAAYQVPLAPLPPLGVPSWPQGARDHSMATPLRLVAFTDGFVERRGEVIDREIDRLTALVNDHHDAPVDELSELILKSDLGNPDDDAAVMCVQFAREDRE